MEFCPKCGKRLVPTRKKQGEKNILVLKCPKCGYEKSVEGKAIALARVVAITPKERIAIIDEKVQKLRTLPTVTIACPRCGNNTAYVWQVQTRGSDESSTQFFRCTKCGYTFREYS